MTREEILKMEAGREMDILIAVEIMKWREVFDELKNPYWETDFHYNHDESQSLFRVSRTPGTPGKNWETDKNDWVERWSPSTDISAAWEVVEKMIGDGYNFSAAQSAANGHHPHAIFTNAKDEEDRDNEWQFEDTFPLAICRAALLAVMETE